jgi:hypothetical protein
MEDRWDILTTVNTSPAFIAVDLPVVNLGVVNNRGFEIELAWKDKVNKNFGYRIKGNFSFARNTIIEMDEIPKEYPWQVETGLSVGQNFGYVFDGFVTEEDLASGKLPDHHTDLKPGDAKYKDLNGDNDITTVDMQAIGHTRYPEITGGLTIGFDFWGFDFSMLWSGAALVSRYINSDLRIPFGPTQLLPLQRWIYEGRWTEATAATAELPRVSTLSVTNNYTTDSSLWLRNAAYLRLKNIQLGYTFDLPALKKAKIRGLTVYATAENLWTLDSYKISDPDNTNSSYPLQTIATFGVNLTF